MILKTCRHCRKYFTVEDQQRGQTYCSEPCRTEGKRATYKREYVKHEGKERQRKWSKKNQFTIKSARVKNSLKKNLQVAKRRAEDKSLPFNITMEDLPCPTHCPVLGIPLFYGNKINSPSIDRIIPALGYTRGNVRVISTRANLLKSNVTDPEELQKVVDDLRRCVNQDTNS